MRVRICGNQQQLGNAAAREAARILTSVIEKQGEAVFVAATGASQFEFLKALTTISSIDWLKTTMFHLDEYIGIPENHPASFIKYLKERLINKVHPGVVHLIGGIPEIQSQNAND